MPENYEKLKELQKMAMNKSTTVAKHVNVHAQIAKPKESGQQQPKPNFTITRAPSHVFTIDVLRFYEEMQQSSFLNSKKEKVLMYSTIEDKNLQDKQVGLVNSKCLSMLTQAEGSQIMDQWKIRDVEEQKKVRNFTIPAKPSSRPTSLAKEEPSNEFMEEIDKRKSRAVSVAVNGSAGKKGNQSQDARASTSVQPSGDRASKLLQEEKEMKRKSVFSFLSIKK